MQSYNEDRVITNSQVLSDDLVERMRQLQNEIENPDIKYVTIGKIPLRGEIVEINGLKFHIIMRNEKKKRMTLELL